MGLSKAETLTSTPGEIQDLYACKAIANGAKQKLKVSSDELDARTLKNRRNGGEVEWL